MTPLVGEFTDAVPVVAEFSQYRLGVFAVLGCAPQVRWLTVELHWDRG